MERTREPVAARRQARKSFPAAAPFFPGRRRTRRASWASLAWRRIRPTALRGRTPAACGTRA